MSHLGPELITNGGMETGNPPAGWNDEGADQTFERSAIQKHTGSYSAHCMEDGTGGIYAGFFEDLSSVLIVGKTYKFSFWYYLVTGTLWSGLLGGEEGETYNSTGNWIYAEMTRTITDTDVSAMFYNNSSSNPIDFYIDDVSVKEMVSGDTIRQDIIDAIDARLKGILIANGYETDVGNNVWDWRAEALEEGDLPALIYKDLSCETEIDTFTSFIHRMTVNVQAVVSDTTPMATVRKIIADIDKAINVDQSWGQLALLTERVGDESGVEIQGMTYAGCTINFLITFRTQGWDDYTTI